MIATTVGAMFAAQLGSVAVVVATVGSVSWIIPQGVHALRSRNLVAVSLWAYLLILVENVGWIVYGVGVGRYAYAVAPLVQIPVSALIVTHACRSRMGTSRDVAQQTSAAQLSVPCRQ